MVHSVDGFNYILQDDEYLLVLFPRVDTYPIQAIAKENDGDELLKYWLE